jgi:hypothetical protein
VRHGVRGGQGRSTVCGRREVKEVGASVGEAMDRGGRGSRRWWGSARHSRKRRSSVGEAWSRRGRGIRSSDTRSGGPRRQGREVGQRRVRRAMWGRVVRAGGAWGRSVGARGWTRSWVDRSIGPLGPSDRSLVHHTR